MTDPLNVTRNGKPIDLSGLWAPHPAFLCGSGPTLPDYPLERLQERGVVSFGINNAAAVAHTKAWTFSDPQSKFHHALYFDPAVMTFAPHPKLKKRIIVKTREGFHSTDIKVRDCPNTYGFDRSTQFDPENFFSTAFAHWGSGKHQPKNVEPSGCLATLLIGVRLLYYLGVRTIYLLGIDHYGNRRRWKKEDRVFERLLPVFERVGLDIFNCNPKSGCQVFPFRSWDFAIADCKGSIVEPLDLEGWYSKKEVSEQCKRNQMLVPAHYRRVENVE